MNTSKLAELIESFAPLYLQEKWDNCGYNVNMCNDDIRGVLLCLDITRDVVREAGELGCTVIISHHPILFHDIRKLNVAKPTDTVVACLVQAGISAYCAHTTMDISPKGLNHYVAEVLGMQEIAPLQRARMYSMHKLAVTVPVDYAEDVRNALFEAGAGAMGHYRDCSFSVRGTGTFRPMHGAEPFVGELDSPESVDEVRLEVLVPSGQEHAVLQAARRVHPYEVPALDLYPVEADTLPGAGLGAIGQLSAPVRLDEFARSVKKALQCPCIQLSGAADDVVERVAVCTGAGAQLASVAASQGADVLVTGEAKHNEFVDATVALIAAGHYDTEKWFADAMRRALQGAGLELQYNVDIYVSQHARRPYTVI